MELLIPGWMVVLAAAVGAGIGAFLTIALIWRIYTDTDSARHNYMARQLSGVRRRNNDWEPADADPFPPSRRIPRLIHYLLDKLYSRGRPNEPRRNL